MMFQTLTAMRRPRRRPAPRVRCEEWDRFGCPGGPAGDEFAPPVDVHCRQPATFVAKAVDPFPFVGGPVVVKRRVCDWHAADANRDGERVYRFRHIR